MESNQNQVDVLDKMKEDEFKDENNSNQDQIEDIKYSKIEDVLEEEEKVDLDLNEEKEVAKNLNEENEVNRNSDAKTVNLFPNEDSSVFNIVDLAEKISKNSKAASQMYRTLSKRITNNFNILQSKMSNIDRRLHQIELKYDYLNKKMDSQNINLHKQLAKHQPLKESKSSTKQPKPKRTLQKPAQNKKKLPNKKQSKNNVPKKSESNKPSTSGTPNINNQMYKKQKTGKQTQKEKLKEFLDYLDEQDCSGLDDIDFSQPMRDEDKNEEN